MVCNLVKPIGVVYTNISREHTQVSGVPNDFKDYFYAKQVLSSCMGEGVIISNVDDPKTMYIAKEKEKQCYINLYGLDINWSDDLDSGDVECLMCGKFLEYSKVFMGHRGFYSCPCGF